MAKSLAQEFQELKKEISSKKARYHQLEGEIAGLEKQMKDEHGTTPDKASADCAALEKKEKDLLNGVKRGLSAFKEKYGIEDGDEDESQ